MAFKYFQTEQKAQEPEIQVRNPQMDLTAPELELILKLLAQTTFVVKDIETLYIALYKLQEQYKTLINEQRKS